MQRRGKKSRTGRSQEKVTRWDESAILGTEQGVCLSGLME